MAPGLARSPGASSPPRRGLLRDGNHMATPRPAPPTAARSGASRLPVLPQNSVGDAGNEASQAAPRGRQASSSVKSCKTQSELLTGNRGHSHGSLDEQRAAGIFKERDPHLNQTWNPNGKHLSLWRALHTHTTSNSTEITKTSRCPFRRVHVNKQRSFKQLFNNPKRVNMWILTWVIPPQCKRTAASAAYRVPALCGPGILVVEQVLAVFSDHFD